MLEGRRMGDSAVVRRLLRSELRDDEDSGREAAGRGTGSESRRGRWCVDVGGLSIIPSSGAVSGCRSPGRSWCRVWSGPDWRRKSNHVSLPYASGGWGRECEPPAPCTWLWLPEKGRAGVPAASPSRRLGDAEGEWGPLRFCGGDMAGGRRGWERSRGFCEKLGVDVESVAHGDIPPRCGQRGKSAGVAGLGQVRWLVMHGARCGLLAAGCWLLVTDGGTQCCWLSAPLAARDGPPKHSLVDYLCEKSR
jgi:hypothetical protein